MPRKAGTLRLKNDAERSGRLDVEVWMVEILVKAHQISALSLSAIADEKFATRVPGSLTALSIDTLVGVRLLGTPACSLCVKLPGDAT